MTEPTLFDCPPSMAAIRESYSGDRICEGTIRRPIKINGVECVVTGTQGRGIDATTTYFACELIPLRDFKGKPTTYDKKAIATQGKKARRDPRGFYYGVKVKWKGSDYVLGKSIKGESSK